LNACALALVSALSSVSSHSPTSLRVRSAMVSRHLTNTLPEITRFSPDRPAASCGSENQIA
jgi:hypothetical protein